MLSCSVNWKLVQQLQAVILFLIEVLLSLNLSRQKVAGEGKKKPFLIVFQLSADSFYKVKVHPPVGRKSCCMRKAAWVRKLLTALCLHSTAAALKVAGWVNFPQQPFTSAKCLKSISSFTDPANAHIVMESLQSCVAPAATPFILFCSTSCNRKTTQILCANRSGLPLLVLAPESGEQGSDMQRNLSCLGPSQLECRSRAGTQHSLLAPVLCHSCAALLLPDLSWQVPAPLCSSGRKKWDRDPNHLAEG